MTPGILTSIYSKETEANMSDIYSYDYDIAITAMLNIKTYDNLDVIIDLNESEGNYTLESDPGGGFSHFSSYSLSASPKLGFEFENWEGDSVDKLLFDSNEINNQILIDGNISLTAVFKPKVYNLNLDSEGMGWVEGPDNFTINEDNFVVVAHNFQGYRFTHWSGDTNYLSDIFTNETNRTLTWGRVDNAENLPKDLSLTAHFVPETHQILVSSKVGGSIDYFLEGNYSIVNDEEGNLTISADSETRVGLIAFTDPGWKFSNWVTNSFDISDLNDSAAIFYPTDDANFSANFQPIEYNSSQVSITSSSGGEIEWDVTEFLGLEPSQYTFLHFEDYNISAIPDTGYRFIGWNGEGGATQLSYAITNPINELVVGGPISLVAEFELIEYPSDQISITPNDNSYGAVEYESNSNGNMTHFGEYLLRATPKPGYHFVY